MLTCSWSRLNSSGLKRSLSEPRLIIQKLRDGLAGLGIEVLAGQEAFEAVAASANVDTVVAAVVGFAGLRPTAAAVAAGREVALANKETLVVAGEMITTTAARTGCRLLPVDSEHSAILQCLNGEPHASIEKIILTASGGPFRNTPAEKLAKVTSAGSAASSQLEHG